MFRIDEPIPANPLHGEVVLHVRRLLRSLVRRGDNNAANALALLFGFPWAEGAAQPWRDAASAPLPLSAGAAVAAELRGASDGIVTLGHDDAHVTRCRGFLRNRARQDDAFEQILADDLATLLELSRAREMAVATGFDPEDGGQRALPILIRGETGTGKELLARALHRLAHRDDGAPFQVIHVAGLPDDMINSELFGHVKGAFTDAKAEKEGLLRQADGGTLLIDEVGDLPDTAQVRLLRFLQDQRVSKLGSNESKKLKVRVVAATLRDLDADVKERRFRLDLLHRLRAGSDLILPPLRNRDCAFDTIVPELLRRRGCTATPTIARSARDAIAGFEWPGNLRELVGVLDQALAVADGDTIRVEHLPSRLQRAYLDRPLHERAVGFLSDELDGQLLDEKHAAWRVRQVETSLEGVPSPSESPETQSLGRFLEFLDDQSPEHQRVTEAVKKVAAQQQAIGKQELVVAAFQALAAQSLPAPVTALVVERTSVHKQTFAALESDLETIRGGLHLEQHPWLRMLQDLQSTPLLRVADQHSVMAAFITIFNIVRAVAPGFVKTAGEAYSTGGLAALRDLAMKKLKEPDEESDPKELEAIKGAPPGQLTEENWRVLAEQPTMVEVKRLTGFDGATVNKYFTKFGLTPRWRRGRPETSDDQQDLQEASRPPDST